MIRRKSKIIFVGNVGIGGNNPISVQTMIKENISNVATIKKQIKSIKNAGGDLVRISIPSIKDIYYFCKIKENSPLPLIADVHFSYKLAIDCIENGADCLRINPSNIGSDAHFYKIIEKAKDKRVPIRLGINSGSINKGKTKYANAKDEPQFLADYTMRYIQKCENVDFNLIKVSIKSSDVLKTIYANRIIAKIMDYPIHIGITEAGGGLDGIVNSSVGIGILLFEGIGDTIRVSLTSSPLDEVACGISILKSMNMKDGIRIISCPTCSRCKIDVLTLSSKVRNSTKNLKKNLVIAIMGCEVNGPGEAMSADIGIAGSRGGGIIFKKGKILERGKINNIIENFINEIKKCN